MSDRGSAVLYIPLDDGKEPEGLLSALEAATGNSGRRSVLGSDADFSDPSALISDALTLANGDASALYTASGDVSIDSRIAAALGVPVLFSLTGNTAAAGNRLQAVVATAQSHHATVAGVVTPAGDIDTGSIAGIKVIRVDDSAALKELVADAATEPVMGPELFQHSLLERAREARARIVLPEGEDDRILQAAHELLELDVCDLTILGNVEDIRHRAGAQGLDLSRATLADPQGDDEESKAQAEEFAQVFAELRAKKGVTIEQARETMKDISYYATMMIYQGKADGMVSGAAHTTAHTIRPALQIIKTKPGASVVSSIFLMVMTDKLWAFGDCAVNPNPTAEQLGEMAVESARTAAGFGIDPKVAMLSYSTGDSGSGADVERAIAATAKAKELDPELAIAGPIQFDAAVVPSVGEKKLPGNPVAGHATVFQFPDLDAGNIAYKAVQRTADCLAVGPVLQGLKRPVNDLSRGATVADIVNTVAVTAVQTAAEGDRS